MSACRLSVKHMLVVCCGYVDFIDGTVYFHLYTWLLFVIMNGYFLKGALATRQHRRVAQINYN